VIVVRKDLWMSNGDGVGRRLVAVDMDGTLLNSHGSVSRRNVAALRAAREQGWFVCLATGRPVGHRERLLPDDDVVTHGVMLNGAEVVALPSGDVLNRRSFEMGVAQDVVSFARAQSPEVAFAFATDSGFAHEPGFLERLPTPGPDDSIPDVLTLTGSRAVRLMAAHPTVSASTMIDVLVPRFGGQLGVDDMGAEVVAIGQRDTSKVDSLQWLCRYLGVPREQVVVFGDGPNDVTMIRWAGYGVAMGNAPATVAAFATEVAPGHDDDGVAVVLERLLGL
jgi:hydroxymethylpyrimidine pyrophosphatase-like HAD family hydrolase